ncbi:peroxidase-related enzyme [Antarcticirhabdus aurantiaca]|uniref:Peroxidase-related enzyme n=1 Tax=Antarcticirhabdus aurantiaca TaxID=2606717 RepID=A0ACD4NRQ9_9HYPH|nr:peroxidase-related enzyme [Antarcticirhabdus aurantiaca]WAJ29351.1 peroxidase-related enzyme [Jeongeuplla avenae]
MSEVVHDFTLSPVDWRPYVEPVVLGEASPEQLDALKTTPSNKGISAYALTLALDPEMLAERTPLFNDIMYAPGGLSRAERELGSLAASVMNRCVYCAYVHATRFIQLDKRPEVVEAIYRNGAQARLDERDQAILDVSVKLTRAPDTVGAADRDRLRSVGLSDLEILDLVHAVSIFGWANRLMHTLGEPFAKTP